MNMLNNFDYVFKILILGESSVGKSSLLMRFVEHSFDEECCSTIGVDFKVKMLEIDDKIVKLICLDTAGCEQYNSIISSYYKGLNGVMICFDTTDKQSFYKVKKWVNEVRYYTKDDIPICLVGTKSDLNLDRKVPYEEIIEYANFMDFNYVETSAKNDTNINDAFIRLSKDIKTYEIATNNLKTFKRNQIFHASIKGNKETKVDGIFNCCGGRKNSCF